VIAPFGDLEIANVWCVTQILPDTRMGGYRIRDQTARGECGHESVQIVESKEEIDLRHLVSQILLIALYETPHTDDRLDLPSLLERGGLEQRVDRLLLGSVDEAARVDEDDVGRLDVLDDRRTVTHQVSNESLRIDGGLVTAQGDDTEFHDPNKAEGERQTASA
jgi:hypothetical protein